MLQDGPTALLLRNIGFLELIPFVLFLDGLEGLPGLGAPPIEGIERMVEVFHFVPFLLVSILGANSMGEDKHTVFLSIFLYVPFDVDFIICVPLSESMEEIVEMLLFGEAGGVLRFGVGGTCGKI